MPIYKRRWVRITIVTLFAIIIGFSAYYNVVYKPFNARLELTLSCASVFYDDCPEQTEFIMQAMVDYKEQLLNECPELHDDLIQDAIDSPYSIRLCLRDIGLLG